MTAGSAFLLVLGGNQMFCYGQSCDNGFVFQQFFDLIRLFTSDCKVDVYVELLLIGNKAVQDS